VAYFTIFMSGLLCLAAVFRGGTRWAFLTVYLVVLSFVPATFHARLQHLPPLSCEDMALFSLGIGMVLKDIRRWRFSRMDCWIAMFVIALSWCEHLPWGNTGALEALEITALWCLVPYMLGKLLLEQPGMREETVRRLIILTGVASVLAMPEFFLKWNPYIHVWSHFFPGQYQFSQYRRGFGRLGGPYGGAETAGMVLLMVLILAFWLNGVRRRERYPLKYGKLIVLSLLVTILMTQSRGPWIGLIVGLSVASIGRARRPIRRSVLVFGLLLFVGVPLYSQYTNYLRTAKAEIGSETQTAQYRQVMLDNYVPVAKLGGAWGWGNVYPIIQGQTSIDNEFLLVWVTAGYIGLIALILIFVEAIISLGRLGIKARSFQDRYFTFSLLGIVIGMAVCLYTVWLSLQSYQLFFIIIGWSQSIRLARAADLQPGIKTVNEGLSQAVGLQVYT
jgi:hypothetical protein